MTLILSFPSSSNIEMAFYFDTFISNDVFKYRNDVLTNMSFSFSDALGNNKETLNIFTIITLMLSPRLTKTLKQSSFVKIWFGVWHSTFSALATVSPAIILIRGPTRWWSIPNSLVGRGLLTNFAWHHLQWFWWEEPWGDDLSNLIRRQGASYWAESLFGFVQSTRKFLHARCPWHPN